MLQYNPSELYNHILVDQASSEPLRYVASMEGTAPILQTYYHTVADAMRPLAAAIIAQSRHADAMISPDEVYLRAWMHHVFVQDCAVLANELVLYPEDAKKDVLEKWLRNQPALELNLPNIVTDAFYCSGIRQLGHSYVKTVVYRTIPAPARSLAMYEALLGKVPSSVGMAAKYVAEEQCLLRLNSEHCAIVAGLHEQWKTLYPQSTRVSQINPILETMSALGCYDADALRVGLGLQNSSSSELPLPPQSILDP